MFKHIITLIIIAICACACTPKVHVKHDSVNPKAASWDKAVAYTISTPMPKQRAIALPVDVHTLKKYGSQKCSKGVCPTLITKAIYWDGKKARTVRFVLFHHAPGYHTPTLVLKKVLSHNTTPTMVYSCWMDHWPLSMEKYAPWTVVSGRNQLADYGLPTYKHNNTIYHWYIMQQEQALATR